MPSINPSLTGSGVAAITGGTSITVLEFEPRMTVAGDRVDFDGPSGIERIHHAGWVGLINANGGATPNLITFSWFLRHPEEDIYLTDGHHFASHYAWDLTPGTTVELEIDW